MKQIIQEPKRLPNKKPDKNTKKKKKKILSNMPKEHFSEMKDKILQIESI